MSRCHASRIPVFTITLALVLIISWGVQDVLAQRTSQTLTNAAVVKLVRAGFKEKTVISIIHSRPNRFQLEPDKLIELKRNGVSENIILAMMAQNEEMLIADDGWGDDSFFRRDNKTNNSSPSGQGQTDIFGSSSGASSESRSRGGERGSSGGEGITTGSATVRIIRPPTEAGGAALKLEKTPTLDNEAIINLVEAGFSEGTIIKRIENSPGEFDLSPAKLVELRKHRVTDPIIAAMTNAMEGSDSKSTGPGGSEEK